MAEGTSAQRRIRIGIAGLGAVAQSVYLPLIFRRWDLFELVAISDLSPRLLSDIGDQYGIPEVNRYLSYETMLEEIELDGFLLLTSGSHGTPAAEAIRKGIPVYCEKPIAFSLAEIATLDDLEIGAGKPMLLLAYMKEYDPAVLRTKVRMPDLEALRWVEVEVLHPSPQSQLAFANLRDFATDSDQTLLAKGRANDQEALNQAVGEADDRLRHLYSSVIIGSLIHDISALRALIGGINTVDSVQQWANDRDAGSIVVEGTISSSARYNIHWHYLPDYPAYHEKISLHFLSSSIEIEFSAPYLLNAPTELRVITRDGVGERREVFRDVSEAFEAELVSFYEMVVDGVKAPTGIAEGRADLRIAQRIYRSLAEGNGSKVGGEAAEA